MDMPNIITDTPDYVVGVQDGYPVLVPVSASLAGGGAIASRKLALGDQLLRKADAPTFAGLTLTGPLTAAGLVGASNGADATTGNAGEYVEGVTAIGAAVTIVTGTPTTVAQVTLTAGDWDVDGIVIYQTGAATATALAQGINTVTNALPALQYCTQDVRTGTNPAVNPQCAPRTRRVSVGVTTTLYLVSQCVIGANITAYGTICARRAANVG